MRPTDNDDRASANGSAAGEFFCGIGRHIVDGVTSAGIEA